MLASIATATKFGHIRAGLGSSVASGRDILYFKKATSRTADMDHAVVTGNLTRDLMQVKQHAEEMRRRDEQLARKG